jgi:hypothetical protein
VEWTETSVEFRASESVEILGAGTAKRRDSAHNGGTMISHQPVGVAGAFSTHTPTLRASSEPTFSWV